MNYFHRQLIIIGLAGFAWLSLGGALFLVFRKRWRARSRYRALAQNGMLTLLSAGLAWILLEAGFLGLMIRTDGNRQSISERLWGARYWHPVNSLGYRDDEHSPASWRDRRVVYVVGDSFTAGLGIKDYRNRYAGVLQRQLGEDWEVITIAQNGWETPEEYQALAAYPARPEIVVLGYYLNDIQGAAAAAKRIRPEPFTTPNGPIGTVVRYSHVLNYAYWRWKRSDPQLGEAYWRYLENCYADPVLAESHQRELQQIADWCARPRARLMVVIFPWLQDVERSRPLTAQVAGWLRGRQVETIDLAPGWAGKSPAELTVNQDDAHPNEAAHREVGNLLAAAIRQELP